MSQNFLNIKYTIKLKKEVNFGKKNIFNFKNILLGNKNNNINRILKLKKIIIIILKKNSRRYSNKKKF